MNIDTAIQGITHFFNDIIGAVVPGFILLVGLFVIFEQSLIKQDLVVIISNGYFIFALLAFSYATGHALLALHKELIEVTLKKIRYKEFKIRSFEFKARKFIDGNSENISITKLSKPYLFFKTYFEESMTKNSVSQLEANIKEWSFNDLRSMAMSVSNEAASLGQRFMFISLLCNGIGTALIILLLNFLAAIFFVPHLLRTYQYAYPELVQIVMLFFLAVLFFRRGDEFNKRAHYVPFCVVISKFWKYDKNND